MVCEIKYKQKCMNQGEAPKTHRTVKCYILRITKITNYIMYVHCIMYV